jgi:hypothetical protein
MLCGQYNRSLRPYSLFSRQEPLLVLSSISSVVFTRLSDPVPDPQLLKKSGSAGNQTLTSGSVARNSVIRTQRRSTFFYMTHINSIRTSQETQYISVV